MNINKNLIINESLESETQILLNARRNVIISLSILLIWLFIGMYAIYLKYLEYETFFSIYIVMITIHAFLCGKLYKIMLKNMILPLIIGILIVVFSSGIGTIVAFTFTFYLLVKSSDVLKITDKNGREKNYKKKSKDESDLEDLDYSEETLNNKMEVKRMKGNNFIKIILIVLAILFGVYVWPTPYRNISSGYPNPKKYYLGNDTKIPFRINRITGTGYIWINGIWRETK